MLIMRPALACILATFVLLRGVPALAQDAAANYPNKPVTLILFTLPGGSSEYQTRNYASKLQASLGKPILLDFKAGAGGAIGAAFVAKSVPDGYTLLVTTPAFSTLPAFNANLAFDPIRDFGPVVLLSKQLAIFVVHPSVPVKNVQEYIAYARANPGKLNWGTSGVGSTAHLTGAWFNELTGTEATFVHYKGAPQMEIDFIAGRVTVAAMNFSVSAPLVKAGKLRALGMASSVRSAQFPDLPTVREQGVDYENALWFGITAPAQTPAAIVAKLNAEFIKALKTADVQQALDKDGSVSVGGTPAEFGRHIVSEVDRWKRLVKQTGMQLQ